MSRKRAITENLGASQIDADTSKMDADTSKRRRNASCGTDSYRVAGQIEEVTVENFMCHSKLTVNFDSVLKNCIFIEGPNGSGKSAILAALQLGLGGKGASSERGKNVSCYIKNGKTSAKIQVVLSNIGVGMRHEYGERVIVERCITKTSSRYTLRSVGQKGVSSTKKRDIDRLLAAFNIHVESPATWMPQNRCRELLAMKPEKLFEMYFESSGLKDAQEHYRKAEESTKCIGVQVKKLKEVVAEAERAAEKLKKQQHAVRTADEAVERLEKLDKHCLWLQWKSAKLQLVGQLDRVKKLRITLAENESKSVIVERELEECWEKFGLTVRRIAMCEANCGYLEPELNKKNIERGQCHIQYTGVEKEMACIKQKLAELTAAIASKREKVRTIEGSDLSDDLETSKQSLIEVTALLNDRELKHAENCRSFDEAHRSLKELGSEISAISGQLEKSKDEVRRLEREKAQAGNAVKNKFAKFGAEMPAVMKALDTNAARFKKKPIGPLGSYVTMKAGYERYGAVAEKALGKVLRLFICDSAVDRRMLDEVLHEAKINELSLAVARFVGERFDTTRHEPPAKYLTVARVITVTDHTVFNQLVDLAQIEQTIIFDKDDDARTEMKNPPPNVCVAYTLSGNTVYPRRENKAYRFYSNFDRLGNSHLLTDSHSFETESVYEQRIASEKALQAELFGHRRTKEEERAVRDRELAELKREGRKIQDGIVEMRSEKLKIEKKIEMAKVLRRSSFQSQMRNRDMEAVLSNLEKELEQQSEALASKEEELQQWKKKSDEADVAYKKRKDEYLEIANEMRPLQNEKESLDQQCSARKAELKNLTERKGVAATTIERIESEQIPQTRAALGERRQALEAAGVNLGSEDDELQPPFGEEFAKIEKERDAEKERHKLQAKLRLFNENVAKSAFSEELLASKEEELSEMKKELGELKGFYKKAMELIKRRKENFAIMHSGCNARACGAFCSLMRQNKFSAFLCIDSAKKRITISAKPEAGGSLSTTTTESSFGVRLLQNVEALSGGERTLATLCFIASLWGECGMPFRCMDEFDVFLDDGNRAKLIEMIVQLTKRDFPQYQFIFFTPLPVSHLVRDQIKLFSMPRVKREAIEHNKREVDDGSVEKKRRRLRRS